MTAPAIIAPAAPRFDPEAAAPGLVRILAAPLFEVDIGRVALTVPEGTTVAEMVELALPGAGEDDLARVRVMLVRPARMALVKRSLWHRCRPSAAAHVVIRLVPAGRGAVRTALMLVVSIAAAALAGPLAGYVWGGGMFGLSSPAWFSGATQIGLTALGTLAVNALVPPPDQDKPKPAYMISGWRNPSEPDAAQPSLLGTHRVAPPVVGSYLDVRGGKLHSVSLFDFGTGPLRLERLRNGDTPLSTYKNVSIEINQGLPGDPPHRLFPLQVVQRLEGIELRRDLLRNEAGEVIQGEVPELDPVARAFARDAAELRILFTFPEGLARERDSGGYRPLDVVVRLRFREGLDEEWGHEQVLTFVRRTRDPFYARHDWTPPQRGDWEVEMARVTVERDDAKMRDTVQVVALQAFRPEYPLDLQRPHCTVAIDAQSTHQLNGQLDAFNAIATRMKRWWDASIQEWVTPTWNPDGGAYDEETDTHEGAWENVGNQSNPAAHYLHVLTGPEFVRRVPDSAVDMDALARLSEHCDLKGLKYDRYHDFNGRLDDVLPAIAAAGRATPRHDGRRWTVVIDRPSSLIVDHVNPRNARGMRLRRGYFTPPHAFDVPFLDAAHDWQEGVRRVPWPGHVGPVEKTERLILPGKTDPAEIWIETRRRMYELIHRPDRFLAIQDGATRVATRGDQVMYNWDILDDVQRAARVIEVRDGLLLLDDEVTFPEGAACAIRFRVFAGPDDVIGESVVRTVTGAAPRTRMLVLGGDGPLPAFDDIVHFGRAGMESEAVVIRSLEPGQDLSAALDMRAAAPIIDELTDAEVPPPWNGRVGGELTPDDAPPAVPRFVLVASGMDGTGDPDGLVVGLAPGFGPGTAVAAYTLFHRLAGAGDWDELVFPASSAGGPVDGYQSGDEVELQALATGVNGVESALTDIVEATIGADDAEIPAAPIVSAGGNLGHAWIDILVPAGDSAVTVEIFANGGGDLDEEADFLRVSPATPGVPLPVSDGDTTRVNLFVDGDMTAGLWATTGGWAHATDRYVKTPGAGGNLSQTVLPSAMSGKTLRFAFVVSGRTAGQVRPSTAGAATQNGSFVDTDGLHHQELTPSVDNTIARFNADSAFDGAIERASVYVRTPTCLPQGTRRYWVRGVNIDGARGPAAGPVTVTID